MAPRSRGSWLGERAELTGQRQRGRETEQRYCVVVAGIRVARWKDMSAARVPTPAVTGATPGHVETNPESFEIVDDTGIAMHIPIASVQPGLQFEGPLFAGSGTVGPPFPRDHYDGSVSLLGHHGFGPRPAGDGITWALSCFVSIGLPDPTRARPPSCASPERVTAVQLQSTRPTILRRSLS